MSLSSTLRNALPVWLIALAIVAAAELAARGVMGDDETWMYWNRTMASKVRFLQRKAAQGEAPDLYIVGDSSAAFNIVPNVLDPAFGSRSFNLGSAGNYARSFDVVMRQRVLPSLPDPEILLVSFAGAGFLPESKGQTDRILASPMGQRLQGNRVWGDHLWLVRIHHLLRLYRDPAVTPTVFRNQGFEPYNVALQRRARRPRLANQLPPPPEILVRPTRRTVAPDPDPLAPLGRLFDYARGRGIHVVMITPPTNKESFYVDEVGALCAERGVPWLNYDDAPIVSHNSHLMMKPARAFTKELAEDLLELKARDFRPGE